MHIDIVPNRNSPPAVLLRESYREGTKVRKRTLANLSALSSEQVDVTLHERRFRRRPRTLGLNVAGLASLGLCLLAFGSTQTSQALSTANWVLQLPTGRDHKPDTISSSKLGSGYSSIYYHKADDGGQIFMVPAKGITTSGSKHCRTEMRESTAGWSASATNRMTVKGKLIQVGGGPEGKVTIGQVFNGTDSIPLAELQYSTSKNGFVLLYEEAKGHGKCTNLNTPVSLGSQYTFEMELTKNVLTVTIDGKTVYTHTPSNSILDKTFYFKYGNYDQTTTASTKPGTEPYTVVENYSVLVAHARG